MSGRLIRVWLPLAIATIAIGIAVAEVVRNGDTMSQALRDMGPARIGLSFALGLAASTAVALLWLCVLRGLGAQPASSNALGVFFVSQLGKYLPGSVWPVLAQMEFGRRNAISRRTMLAANVITIVLNLTLGLITAALLLPLSSPDSLRRYWWTLLLLPVLAGLLHPRAIPMLLDWFFVRLGREPLNERLPLRSILLAAACGVVSWLLFGLHLYVLVSALGASGGHALMASIGGFAFAVSVGIIFIPAPAGAGVRDAILIATLGGTVGPAHALAVSLASRVLLVLVDLVLAGGGVILLRLLIGQRRAATQREL
jgi:glycosyltransferase 2 family protein